MARKPGGYYNLVVFQIYKMFKDRSTWYIKYQIDLYTLHEDCWNLIWLVAHSDEDEGESLFTLIKGGW